MITYLVGLGSLMVIYSLQITFYFLTKYFAIQYFDYVGILNILSYSLFFISICGISGVILSSKTLSKIHVSIYLCLLGIIMNIILIFIFTKYNYGLHGVAASSVLSISITGLLQFLFCREFIFQSRKELSHLLLFGSLPPLILLITQVIFFNSNVYFSIVVFLLLAMISLYLYLNKIFLNIIKV